MSTGLNENAVNLLKEPHLAHVATVGVDGQPQVTPVWIDTDGANVIFNTAKGRVKHRNLVRDPRVTVSVVDKNDPYRTLQVQGRARLVDDENFAGINALAKKYLGLDTYPHRQPGEQRVEVVIEPVRISGTTSG